MHTTAGTLVTVAILGVAPRAGSTTLRPPFSVLWNSPWPACCGVKAEQQLLPDADPLPQFAGNNITVNDRYDPWSSGGTKDRCGNTTIPCFNGPHVVTIYTEQTGLYPHYQYNSTTGRYVPVHGGLPQNANLTAHLAKWKSEVLSMIPDAKVSPVIGLDWEDWEPWFDGNDARPMAEPGQDIYQNESMRQVRMQHPAWSDAQIRAQAKKEFNEGAEAFWTATFQLAKQLRPKALWSNYDVGKCATHGCGDAEYYPWQKRAEHTLNPATGKPYRPKTFPPLPTSQPAPFCATPNDNDAELGWLWKLVDTLEPVIYLSNQNASFNTRYLDCKLGEARRIATVARSHVRGGRRVPIYAYAWYDWNAMCAPPDCPDASSQYLNRTALQAIFLRAAMKHGVDGVFMWGGGFRDCAQAFECKGNGTCTGGHCELFTSLGTYVNTLLGPEAKRAVETAAECSETHCSGHGRCFDCPEPFRRADFARCICDCDDGHAGATCNA